MSAVDLQLNNLALPFLAVVNDLSGHGETGNEIAERRVEGPFVVAAADDDLDIAAVELGFDRFANEIYGVIHATELPQALFGGRSGNTKSALKIGGVKPVFGSLLKAFPRFFESQALTGRTSKIPQLAPLCAVGDRPLALPRAVPVGDRTADLIPTLSPTPARGHMPFPGHRTVAEWDKPVPMNREPAR